MRELLADPARVAEVEQVMARGALAPDPHGDAAVRGAVLARYLGVDPQHHAVTRGHDPDPVLAGWSDPRRHGPWSALGDVARLCRRRRRWTRDEALLLWWHALRFPAGRLGWWTWDDVLHAPLAAVDAVPQDDRAPFEAAVTELGRRVRDDECSTAPEDRRRLVRRLGVLLGSRGGDLPPHLLDVADPFGARTREQLHAGVGSGPTAVVVQHLATYAGGVRAPARWRRQTRELLAEDLARPEVVVELLRLVPEHEGEEQDVMDGGGVYATSLHFVDEATITMLRAAVWACGEILAGGVPSTTDRDEVLGVLVRAAEHCGTVRGTTSFTRCPQVASSTVALLAELDPAEAAPALARLRGTLRNKALRRAVDRAAENVADRAGVPVARLVERTVPTFGLDASGRTDVRVGPAVAAIVATSPTRFAVRWPGRGGRVVPTVPGDVRDESPDELAELRTRVRAASKALAAQRDRLEGRLVTNTPWTGADWLEHCVGHPVTGRVAETLLWRASTADDSATGLPERDGDAWALVDVVGRRHPVHADDEVRLWHPLLAPLADVLAWRDRLVETETRQAFRQAFREVYLATEAERRTETYSNRFAAHVLAYHRARAVLRSRGWDVGYLGPWDGGYEDDSARDLPGTGWRATYRHEFLGVDDAELCSTDRVCFWRADGDGTPARIDDVPALVFSEAMRDVDLVVGVASVAADPTWADRGPEDVHAYWERESTAALGEAASVRREALATILPRTRIADRVSLDERYLTVRGDLRTYRIHVGSGSILMAPDDHFLCIVPAGRGPRVFLPFEDDGGRLAHVLSKAFLLADDAAITDPVILAQIHRRTDWTT